MKRIMLLAKLHRAVVTEADLHYEGSCGIDENLMEAADMREFEKIELYNINNGERFSTYIIKAARGSGAISLNGAAARKAHVGDHLIICTYGPVDDHEVAQHIPKVVLLDDQNRIKRSKKLATDPVANRLQDCSQLINT
jgi:aspartate 1-decarboxylase